MVLEALKPNCCANRRLLTIDGRAWGEMRGHSLRERAEVRLTGRGRYRFVKTGSWSGRFDLTSQDDGKVLATVESGAFERQWRMLLPSGLGAVLRPDGLFKQSFTLVGEDGGPLASVKQRGDCNLDIIVDSPTLEPMDMLVLAFVYDIVQRRRAGAAAASG